MVMAQSTADGGFLGDERGEGGHGGVAVGAGREITQLGGGSVVVCFGPRFCDLTRTPSSYLTGPLSYPARLPSFTAVSIQAVAAAVTFVVQTLSNGGGAVEIWPMITMALCSRSPVEAGALFLTSRIRGTSAMKSGKSLSGSIFAHPANRWWQFHPHGVTEAGAMFDNSLNQQLRPFHQKQPSRWPAKAACVCPA